MGEALDFDTIDAEYEKEVVTVGTVLDLDVIRPTFDQYKAEAARIATDAKALTVTDQESLNIAVCRWEIICLVCFNNMYS